MSAVLLNRFARNNLIYFRNCISLIDTSSNRLNPNDATVLQIDSVKSRKFSSQTPLGLPIDQHKVKFNVLHNCKSVLFNNIRTQSKCSSMIGCRRYSDMPVEPKVSTWPDFGEIQVNPTFFGALKGVFTSVFVRYYFDPEFYLKSFADGVKQALQVVSHKLAEGDFDGLRDLVVAEEIDRVKKILSDTDSSIRRQFAAVKEDIVMCVPYSIDIITVEHDDHDNSYFVDALIIFHVVKDLEAVLEMNEPTSIEDRSKHLQIINYRFKREITKGQESSWIITFINHHKPLSSDK